MKNESKIESKLHDFIKLLYAMKPAAIIRKLAYCHCLSFVTEQQKK